jgi:proteic killer suppression protein
MLDATTVSRQYSSMLASFRDADTELLWQTGRSRKFPANLRMRALKKLFLLHASVTLDNLRVPPGNRLEVLHGQRKGQHSIRINDQYRICFVWREGNAYEVEIVDYH